MIYRQKSETHLHTPFYHVPFRSIGDAACKILPFARFAKVHCLVLVGIKLCYPHEEGIIRSWGLGMEDFS